jgi:peptide chain release factor 2
LDRLEAESAAPDFWNDNQKAQGHVKLLNAIKRVVEPWEAVDKETADYLEMAQMAKEAGDDDLAAEIEAHVPSITKRVEELEFQSMLSDEADSSDCFLQVHSGAGGTESCDWAGMLLRMYSRWAERKKFKVELIDVQEGDEAGVSRATLAIRGEYAFGFLKSENGVHRLVRISPFDANKRRHTSFASVHVYPDIDDTIEVDINENDLRIDTYRSGGAGGQHVNVTDSAVRITHLPTNIVVQCQNERSQLKNKNSAMKVLRARLYQHYRQLQEAEQAEKAGEKKDIAWGSQIRSYVFQPYQMVKDLRTDVETSSIQDVMDGEIDKFIEGYLRSQMGAAKA